MALAKACAVTCNLGTSTKGNRVNRPAIESSALKPTSDCSSASTTRRASTALYAAAVAAMLPLSLFCARAQDAEPPPVPKPPPEPPAPQRFHALSNFEFSNAYLTPRGMIVTEEGLTFQWLLLGLLNIYKGDGFVNDFTLVGGMWNDFNTQGVSVNPPFGSSPKTSWVEIDPIGGVSVGFAKNFRLDLTYTAFNMEILGIPTSQHLETKLSFDDSSYLKAFALHPYMIYWQELSGKATAARVPYQVFLGEDGPPSSFYFEFGVTPSYTVKKIDLKFEAPLRMIMAGEDFYGEYYDDSSTVGLYEVGLRATIPLKFVPPGYGNWSFHAGFRYQGFVDENLQGMQQFNAPGKAEDGFTQYYCGLNVFF